jgi:2-octaprenyl-6-methoxyphenol hydroxylase
VALLPVEERYAFVFTAPPAEAKRLLAADDARFLAELQSHFGIARGASSPCRVARRFRFACAR